MSKLKIDLLNGIIDVEGEESFVRSIYDDFKSKISERQVSSKPISNASMPAIASGQSNLNQSKKKPSTKSNSYQIINDLNIPELRKFFTEKSPSTAFEKNLVFAYYLQKNEKKNAIDVNHIYSCYKAANIPVPGALNQSLRDTASKKKWIDTSDMNSIKITVVGENTVEHDLPIQKKA